MNVWEVDHNLQYQDVGFINPKQDWESVSYDLKGERLKKEWKVIPVDLLKEENRLAGDFSSLATIPVACTKRAVEFLNVIGNAHVELLPLRCTNCQKKFIYLINTVTVINCLNENQSKISRFDSGRVMWIYKYKFEKNKLSNILIFKIPQMLNSKQYATDVFVEEYEKRGLTGLSFKLLD